MTVKELKEILEKAIKDGHGDAEIYVVSSSLESIRENTLYRGVTTYYIKELSDDRDSNISIAVEKIYGSGKLDLLDKIAIISGSSIKNKKTDSILEIVTVKDILNS